MLTLARIETDKGPRVLCLRDLDPAAWAAISNATPVLFNVPHDREARYDRRNKRMIVA
jgi:hypothetical protein